MVHPSIHPSVPSRSRYTVKELLQHDFFSEETGIKVEVVKKDDPNPDTIAFWLRVDPKRRKQQHKENEVIQFEYNMTADDPDKVAMEMVLITDYKSVHPRYNNNNDLMITEIIIIIRYCIKYNYIYNYH